MQEGTQLTQDFEQVIDSSINTNETSQDQSHIMGQIHVSMPTVTVHVQNSLEHQHEALVFKDRSFRP